MPLLIATLTLIIAATVVLIVGGILLVGWVRQNRAFRRISAAIEADRQHGVTR